MSDKTKVAATPDLRPVTIAAIDERCWAWIYRERERTSDLLYELIIQLEKDQSFVGRCGAPGERGEQGPPGKLPVAKAWEADVVHYEAQVVTHAGATWQALRDTGSAPPSRDWICLAAPARSLKVRGTYNADATYFELDIVAYNKGSFIARCDCPGPCPGDGWQLLTSHGRDGKKGEPGEQGARGERGPTGPQGQGAPIVIDWKLDCDAYEATPVMSDGSEGAPLKLKTLFEQFLSDIQ
jgi:hypothetical protein